MTRLSIRCPDAGDRAAIGSALGDADDAARIDPLDAVYCSYRRPIG